jgi:hypothetical protein
MTEKKFFVESGIQGQDERFAAARLTIEKHNK